MDVRIYQVCLTYWQQWPVRVIGVAYFVACAFAIAEGWSRRESYRLVAPHVSRYELEVDPDKHRVTGLKGLEPGLSDWLDDPSQRLPAAIGQRLKTVKKCKLSGNSTSGSHLKLLRTMPNLETFNLGGLPREGLAQIGELQQLRHLVLTGTERSQDLKYLGKLSNLEILEIQRVHSYLRLFEAIQYLPRLHTLVMPEPRGAGFREPEWKLLNSFRGLRSVYLIRTGTNDREYRATLLRVQQLLPAIYVSSSAVSDRRPTAWSAIVMASAIIWFLTFVQFHTQFSHSGSRVVPDYARPHLRVAVWIVVLGTLANTLILWQSGCSFLASLASSVVAPGLGWLWISLSQRASIPQTGAISLNPLFIAFFLPPLSTATMFLSRLFPMDLYWFLEGRYPVIALGLIALSIAMHVLVFRQVPRWHNIFADSGAGLPPLGLNITEWAGWSKDAAVAQQGRQVARFERRYTERLDALLASPGPYGLSQLSIAGNSVGGIQLCGRLMIVGASFAIWLFVLRRYCLGEDIPNSLPRLMTILLTSMGLDAFSIGLAFHWRSRRPMLGYELLRPNSRAGYVSQLFVAIWRDLLPLLMVHPVALGMTVWILGDAQSPLHLLPLAIAYCVFRGLAIYVANLYLLTIRRNWAAILLMQAAWALVAGAGLYVLGMGTLWESSQLVVVWGMWGFAAGIAILACSLVWLKRYWQRIELV